MTDTPDPMTVILAVAALGGAILAGVLFRIIFGLLIKHAADTKLAWDDLGWGLLRSIAIPTAVIIGSWGAAEILPLSVRSSQLVGRALLAAIVLTVAIGVANLAADLVRTVALARSGVANSATIFVNITRVVIITIGVLVLLQSLGISVTPVLTALGVGGIAVALALQPTLANLFAGIQVLASKKVQPGDFIKLESGEDGYVVDINWRNTTIRQLGNNIVVVPNSRLGDTILTNFQQPSAAMSVLVQVGVSYDSDLEHVERVTSEVGREVMQTVEGAVADHEPFIRFHTFDDSSINFSVILRAHEYVGQYLIKHEFIKRLHARYQAEGIEIPFPIRTVVAPAPPGPADDSHGVPPGAEQVPAQHGASL